MKFAIMLALVLALFTVAVEAHTNVRLYGDTTIINSYGYNAPSYGYGSYGYAGAYGYRSPYDHGSYGSYSCLGSGCNAYRTYNYGTYRQYSGYNQGYYPSNYRYNYGYRYY